MQRIMAGRYGSDQLNFFMLVVYLLCYFLSLIPRLSLLRYVGLVVLALALFRMLSRNLDRRRQENARFLKATAPAAQWLRLRRSIFQDREHRYFKCPNCGQHLRVPRGKGKITVTCRACGTSFQEKS
jgi:ribosomal protein S27E